MIRPPHYWRPAGAASAPSNIMVFDTETWHGERAACPGGEFHTLRLGCYLAYRLERTGRSRVVRGAFRTAADFWTALRKRLDERRPLWLFAHNLPYDLGVVDGWGVITGDSFLCDKLAVSGTLTWVKGTLDGYPINLADTLNWYKCPLASIGKAVGIPKQTMPSQEATDDTWERYCQNDVDVTAAGVDRLIEFVRAEELGPWQPTIAGLAFSGFRSRFMSHKVLCHSDPAVLKLERAAYYGGLVDCPRVGVRIPGPIYEADVCSMYPSVCMRPLPTKLLGKGRGLTTRDLERLLKKRHVIAEVTLATTTHTYPCRLKGGVYYPTGAYRTTLATPELMLALDRGHVRRVHLAAWYVAEPCFAEYMGHFVGAKERYKADGNEAFSTIAKYLANSLYGKTGQTSPVWREWNAAAMRILESDNGLSPGALSRYDDKPPSLYHPEETCIIPEVREPLEVRDLWGFVEVRIGERESRDSCPAIAATVTSYARCLLRSYQETAGRGNWFYSDTDSLWVNAAGFANLASAGCVSPGVLGKLAVKTDDSGQPLAHSVLVVHGPKDYETDHVRRLKGVRASAEPTADGGWRQLHFPTALGQIRDRRDGGVLVKSVTKHLRREFRRIVVGRGGHTRPMRFPHECPERIES
jgi:hypothetical protein